MPAAWIRTDEILRLLTMSLDGPTRGAEIPRAGMAVQADPHPVAAIPRPGGLVVQQSAALGVPAVHNCAGDRQNRLSISVPVRGLRPSANPAHETP